MASTYLTRTFGSAGNRRTWTLSLWIKRTGIGGQQNFFGSWISSSHYERIMFNNDKIYVSDVESGSTNWELETDAVYRDTNAWYHLVLRHDTTQSTANDRVRLYVNNVQQTFGTNSQPTQNRETAINTAIAHKIGMGRTSEYTDCVMSHVHFCDGYSYAPTEFGETDSTTGEWKIKTSPSVSYGTTGFFVLKDGNSVTDSSPNSNAFSVGGGTLTKTEDNPSNVFATFNPLWGTAGKTFLFGNTRYQYANNYQRSAITTLAASGTDKIYLEWKHGESDNSVIHLNVLNESVAKDGRFGLDTSNNASYRLNDSNNAITFVHGTGQDGVVNKNGSAVSATDLIQVSNTDTGMMAFDCETGKFWIGKNGTWDKSGNPSTGANPIYTWTDTYTVQDPVWFGFGVEGGDEVSVNFGNGYIATTAVSSAGTNASNLGIFEYDVPTGYKALCTKGLNL